MKGQLIITYQWWVAQASAEAPAQDKAQGQAQRVRAAHRDALEETAQTQIGGLLQQGLSRGVLSDNIRLDDADGEEGIAYAGAWSAVTVGDATF